MGFCTSSRTLREYAADSKAIVYGVVDNPREGLNDDTCDCAIASIIKSHPILRGKKYLILPSKVEVQDRNRPPRYLIFCEIEKGKILPFRAVEVGPAIVDYFKGLMAINPANPVARLRYCFDFLDHPEWEIATDALKEFANTSDREVSQAARKLPAAKLRRWLRDPNLPPHLQGLCAVLLGHCGTANDVILLRSLTARLIKQEGYVLDRTLVGYVLLNPKDGLTQVRGLLTHPSRDFSHRYAAWRAVRYFHDIRPDVIEKQVLLETMKLAFAQSDLADLVIDDLRKWRCWDLTTRILPLHSRRAHELPIIRRAIMRYALACPRPEAAAFVVRTRKTDEEDKKLIQ
jgi:hypothetical protein